VENLKNGKATQFKSGVQAAEKGRKGGINSGKSKKAKKTVQKLLDELCNDKCSRNAVFAELAQKLGLDEKTTVKQLVIFKCLFNTLKRGNMDDLMKIMNIIGEKPTAEEKATPGIEELARSLFDDETNA